jgi:hypothetical protein
VLAENHVLAPSPGFHPTLEKLDITPHRNNQVRISAMRVPEILESWLDCGYSCG